MSVAVEKTYIRVSELPAALAQRGIACSKRKAELIATRRRLPFFPSPIDGKLVITPAQLDRALSEPAAVAEREWKARLGLPCQTTRASPGRSARSAR